MMLIRTQVTLFLMVFAVVLSSQDPFERRYNSAQDKFLTPVMASAGDGYVVLSAQENEEGLLFALNLTALNSKGNVKWSNNFIYGDTLFIREIGEVVRNLDGGYSFSVVLQRDSLNKVVTKTDGQGGWLWSKILGQTSDQNGSAPGRNNIADFIGEMVVNTARTGGDEDLDIMLSALDYEGNSVFYYRMNVMDTASNEFTSRVRDVIQLRDSSLLLLGNTNSADHQLFLTKLDTSGSVVWSRSYTGDFSTTLDESAFSVTELPDSTIAILGAQAGGITTNFVLHLDYFGGYLKSRTINSTLGLYEYFPNSIIALEDGDVAISFKRLNTTTAEVHPVILKYDLDSTSRFVTVLKSSDDRFIDRSGLASGDGKIIAYGGSTYNADSNMYVPYLAKLDEDGKTLCHEDFIDFEYDSVFFNLDTLVWTIDALEEMDTVMTTPLIYSGFNPPTLTLQDTSFCPQDPIRYVVDASVEGGVGYLWDDGNTDSIRLFLEEGEFSVTVTVAGDICFTLCDTVSITKKEEPIAQIAVNTVNFCSDGTIGLLVQSNNLITSISWSTGETSPVIFVDELKQYDVEIVDDCGLTADASIDLSDFSIARNPDLGISQERLCLDNTIELTVINTDLINPDNLLWSTGETMVESIIISEPGTYSVENLEEFCPGMSEIQIGENLFLEPLTAEIVDGGCSNPIPLLLQGTGIASQEWFDGSRNATNLVNEAGTYTVTVMNVCGETLTASIEITEDRIRECVNPPTGEPCLQWPNTFIPESNEPVNTTFGPYTVECSVIENYELNIFNRWGKNIFTSRNVDNRWDGTVDGNEAPGGVYFYYASYGDSVASFTEEGDVTLIR